jgi:hypothetical protein
MTKNAMMATAASIALYLFADPSAAQSTAGFPLKPFAWQPYSTTVSTTNGSPVIGVSAADASRFRNGDHIVVAGCVACDTVISGGGTTSVTLNASATATSPNAAVTVGVSRYDTTASTFTNTVGADNVLIGAAAQGYGDWTGIYDGPGRYRSIGPLKVVSRQGTRSATFASRLSDTPLDSGLEQMENVVNMAILDSRPSGIEGGGWNVYNESRLLAPAQPSLAGLGFISVEDSIYSKWSSPNLDPYQTNITGYAENYRPDCGTGYDASNDCSAAIHIISNGAKYKSGIIFSQDALNTNTPGGYADAIAMAPNQSLSWYRSANNVAWSILSTTSSGGHFIKLRNSDMYVYEAALSLEGASGSVNRAINLKTGDLTLWNIGATATAQSGGNSGADYAIARFNDAGAYLGIPFFVQRSTGNVGINQAAANYTLDVNGTTSSTILRLAATTFSALPACDSGHAGTVAHITDASAAITIWHQNVTAGGGSNRAFVTCNGSGWFAFSY